MHDDCIVSTLDKINAQIEEQVTPQQYRTWFQSLQINDISKHDIHFVVSNDFVREWISRYYSQILESAVRTVLGDQFEYTVTSQSISSKRRDSQNFASLGSASNPQSSSVSHASSKDNNLSSTENSFREQNDPRRTLNPGISDPYSVGFDIALNPKYIFDNFVVGPSNQLAYAAALAVSESPSKSYNPLFIHGSVGLGKTHLLQACCHKLLNHNPYLKILYLSCEAFINQFIAAIEKGDTRHFRDKYRHIDILLIDDIHFIANKERTQEEFFHTFNALYNTGKQIILSSDSHPSEIPTLQDRLISRFKWGLVAKIEAPNFETRYSILKAKARAMGHEPPDDVLTFLAEVVDTNIRELEGAITKVIGFSVLTQSTLDIALARTAMKDVIKKSDSYVTIDDIVRAVTKNFNVKLSELQSKKRHHSITLPRQICMYIAKRMTSLSLQEIGGYFGGRDHTTVLYASDKISKEMKNNPKISNIVNKIILQLGG